MRISLLASAALALSFAVSSPVFAEDWDCNNPDREIEIINGSSYEITAIDIYNDSQLNEDEGNWLSDVLSPDESETFYADPTGEYHTFIVDATAEDGTYATTRVDACQFGASWYISDDDFVEEEGDY